MELAERKYLIVCFHYYQTDFDAIHVNFNSKRKNNRKPNSMQFMVSPGSFISDKMTSNYLRSDK